MPQDTGPLPLDDEDTQAAFMRRADACLATGYRFAVHLLIDPHEAEDATQEALALAWRAWPRLRERDRFGAWFDRILVNACYDRMRARRRRPTVDLPDDLALTTVDTFAGPDARDAIGRALVALNPEQRMVVVLRYWRDLSIEEIADRLGVPSGTVRSRLHYALRALRAEIEPEPGRPAEVRP